MTIIKYDTSSPYMAAPEIPPIKSAVVVTPTIGSKYLYDAMDGVSASKHDYEVTHLIVFDGVELPELVQGVKLNGASTMELPWNVGRHGFYGHRVYAAIGHLVNADAVFFLDEDNFYSEDHIKTCLDKLNEGYDFVHSLRNVVDIDGNHICKDRFEAIGREPIYLIDTSSFCFRTDFLKAAGHFWHWGWGADRRFFQLVKDRAKYGCTEKFSLNYRLDGNPNSPTKDFFFKGNTLAGYEANGN